MLAVQCAYFALALRNIQFRRIKPEDSFSVDPVGGRISVKRSEIIANDSLILRYEQSKSADRIGQTLGDDTYVLTGPVTPFELLGEHGIGFERNDLGVRFKEQHLIDTLALFCTTTNV